MADERKRPGRSATAKRVWVWLDSSDPTEAEALAIYRQIQGCMPPRIRASMLRNVLCEGLSDIKARLSESGVQVVLEPPIVPMPKPIRAPLVRADKKVDARAAVVETKPTIQTRQAATITTIKPAPVESAEGEVEPILEVGNLMW